MESIALNDRISKTRDLALFQFYAGGLRISDVLMLKWSQIENGRLNITIKKTKTQISHMLHEKAIAILDKFKTEASKPSDYVFPIVPNELNEKDLIELDLQISRGTARINKDLKIIATKAEINKPLSTHIIRHTFATLALSLGISTEIIQKILGHSNIRETQIYAKMLDTTVDEQMKKFKF